MKYITFLSAILVFTACSGQKDSGAETTAADTNLPSPTVQLPTATKASVTLMLNAYYGLKDACVEADTALINRNALVLADAADSLKISGFADSAMIKTLSDFAGNIASEARALPEETDITEKRRAFSMITENLYPLLQSVQYNESVVYHEMCPMAFNDNEAAFWLSNSREVVNPYLGKKHPKYHAGMVHCGEVKDSLAYKK